jgi:hypothetical protein
MGQRLADLWKYLRLKAGRITMMIKSDRVNPGHQRFGSSPHSSKGKGTNQEDRAYQNTESTTKQRISLLNREDTAAFWLLVNEGGKSQGPEPKCQDHQA